MTGTYWIISYVVLNAAVLAALTIGIAVSRQLGRVMVSDDGQKSGSSQHRPLVPGDRLPDLVLTSLSGDEVRPAKQKVAAILQIAVLNENDVEEVLTLRERLSAEVREVLAISAIGPTVQIEKLHDYLDGELMLIADTDLTVQWALGTDRRPYLVIADDGQVVTSASVAGRDTLLEDLVSIHNRAAAFHDQGGMRV